jgi:hypothetical protein
MNYNTSRKRYRGITKANNSVSFTHKEVAELPVKTKSPGTFATIFPNILMGLFLIIVPTIFFSGVYVYEDYATVQKEDAKVVETATVTNPAFTPNEVVYLERPIKDKRGTTQ